MNVRRGLFRLWLVCTILYVVVVFLIGWQPIRLELNKAANEEAALKAGSRIPVLCGTARGTKDKDYEGLSEFLESNAFDTCWYSIARYRALYPEDASLDDKALMTKTYGDTNERLPSPPTADPTWAISVVLGAALVPPLLVFLIGSAFVWAFAGFRRAPHA